MDDSTIKRVKVLLEAGNVDEAMVILGRRDMARFLSKDFISMLTDFRSLPNTVATAIRRNDFKNLNAKDLMEALSFVRNTLLRQKKGVFLSRKSVLSLLNLEKDLNRILEGKDVV